MSNGDRVESEVGRGRRPLTADWLMRDAMPTLDSAHTHACWLTCARRMPRASWRQDGREDGVVVVVVVVVVVAGDGVFQQQIAAHLHLFTHYTRGRKLSIKHVLTEITELKEPVCCMR